MTGEKIIQQMEENTRRFIFKKIEKIEKNP